MWKSVSCPSAGPGCRVQSYALTRSIAHFPLRPPFALLPLVLDDTQLHAAGPRLPSPATSKTAIPYLNIATQRLASHKLSFCALSTTFGNHAVLPQNEPTHMHLTWSSQLAPSVAAAVPPNAMRVCVSACVTQHAAGTRERRLIDRRRSVEPCTASRGVPAAACIANWQGSSGPVKGRIREVTGCLVVLDGYLLVCRSWSVSC
jgi:hypothetical protein